MLAADCEVVRRTAEVVSGVSAACAQTSDYCGSPDKENTVQVSRLPPLSSHGVLEPAKEPIEMSTTAPARWTAGEDSGPSNRRPA
jgi:hypothetical protein